MTQEKENIKRLLIDLRFGADKETIKKILATITKELLGDEYEIKEVK